MGDVVTEDKKMRKQRKPKAKVAAAEGEAAPTTSKKGGRSKSAYKSQMPYFLNNFIVHAALAEFNEELRAQDPNGLKIAVTADWIRSCSDRVIAPIIHKSIRDTTTEIHKNSLAYGKAGTRINEHHVGIAIKRKK